MQYASCLWCSCRVLEGPFRSQISPSLQTLPCLPLQVPVGEVAKVTTRNALQFFAIE